MRLAEKNFMKKNLFLFLFASLLITFQKSTAQQADYSQLPVNESFRRIVDVSDQLFSMIENVELPENFDRERAKIDDRYVATILNVPEATIQNLRSTYEVNYNSLMVAYPQFLTLPDEEVRRIVVEALASESFGIYQAGDPCSDCKRVGRAQMVGGLILGARACGNHHLMIWGCGFLGWWGAAEVTLACIKQYCKDK